MGTVSALGARIHLDPRHPNREPLGDGGDIGDRAAAAQPAAEFVEIGQGKSAAHRPLQQIGDLTARRAVTAREYECRSGMFELPHSIRPGGQTSAAQLPAAPLRRGRQFKLIGPRPMLRIP